MLHSIHFNGVNIYYEDNNYGIVFGRTFVYTSRRINTANIYAFDSAQWTRREMANIQHLPNTPLDISGANIKWLGVRFPRIAHAPSYFYSWVG